MIGRILVVEDSPTQAAQLRMHLEAAGLSVDVAGDGEQALALHGGAEYDLVISDIVMPGPIDGYELCRRIKAGAKPAPPVLLLTSLTDPMDIIHGLESGADNFLTKPYDTEHLLDRIGTLLRSRRLSRRPRSRVSVGVRIYFMGREFTITSDREQILGLLVTTFEEAVRQNRELRQREEELRRAEAELARYAGGLEERLQSLIVSSPVPIAVLDPAGHVRAWNPSAERVFGWREEEVVGRPNPLIPEEEREEFESDRRRLLTGELVAGHEAVRRRKDGGLVDVYWTGAAVRDASGRIEATWVMLLDITDRKRAERELRESEERLRMIFEQSLDPVVSTDVEGRVTYWNPEATACFGWERAEAMGRMVGELIVPARFRPGHAAGLRRFAENDSGALLDRRMELTGLRRDGTEFPLEITVVPTRSGGAWSFTAMMRDISERTRAREALEQSERRLRRVIESDLIGMLFWGANGEITDANDYFLRLVGYDRDDLEQGRISWRDLTPPEYVARDEEALREIGARGVCRPYEKEYIHRDGSRVPILIGAAALDETRSGGVAFILDISDRRAAADALRASEERARLILDSTAEGIYGLDLDGNCTFCNPAAMRLLGIPHQDAVLGRNMHDLVHHTRPDGSPFPREECPLFASLHGGGGTHGENELLWRLDGTSFRAEFWSHPMVRDGKVIGAVVTFLDVTDRRKLESHVRQAQKMESIGRLAGGVAHDFNNLLTVILGEAEGAVAALPADSALRESLREIQRAGERAAGLTRQLLAFSRDQVVSRSIFEPDALIREIDRMLSRLLEADVKLVDRLNAPGIQVEMDRGQLEQVLMNLVVNARDAMPDGGTITLETEVAVLDADDAAVRGLAHAGPYLVIAVSDTGHGMSEEVRSRIFEPFFTTKPSGKGTGLGLATCYGIVTQAGGHLAVYSEPGLGTSMRVYLPICSEVPPAEPVVEEPSVRPGAETILLVEDEPAVRRITARMLGAIGYTVHSAESGEEALRILAAERDGIHLLLTDVVMAGMNGRVLAERAAEFVPGLPVLFATGYTGDTVLRHELLEMDAPMLQKPFTKAALQKKLRELLG